ncbi:MAG: hypothetical protein R3362_02665 [Rhodothermales bacterium]|nr:hypothetical protein [Rhodothermales bacterium]
MLDPWVLDLIGYVASALVAVSLMMSSILRLRIINLLGATVFTAYGFLIHAYPVAAVNLFIVFVNLYYLRGLRRTEELFRLLEVPPDSEYVRVFLTFYADEIRRFVPGFAGLPERNPLALFVLRDLVPAGLLLGEVEGHTLHVRLDFVIPPYRDFKVARYLFVEQAAFFRERGITEVVSPPGTAKHEAYLRKLGFEPPTGGASDGYRLVLTGR